MKRGRNPKLIKIRDQKLVERYFHLTEIKRRRFDDVLQILEFEEFFISQTRILVILREQNDYLNQLIANNKNKVNLHN